MKKVLLMVMVSLTFPTLVLAADQTDVGNRKKTPGLHPLAVGKSGYVSMQAPKGWIEARCTHVVLKCPAGAVLSFTKMPLDASSSVRLSEMLDGWATCKGPSGFVGPVVAIIDYSDEIARIAKPGSITVEE